MPVRTESVLNPRVAEAPGPGELIVVSGQQPGLRERDIAQLWEGGRLPEGALVTLEGVALQIVYRGRLNAGAGPDFRDAVIALPDGRLLHGDVELHLRASDFRRHGHARDLAYRNVILHLVFHADDGARTALAGGRQAPIVALDRWLTARAAELRAMIEQPALWREPCQSAVERLGAQAAGATLARLGERRLRQKAAAIGGRNPSRALYQSLLRTLGHGPHQDAWLLLADRAPLTLIDRLAGAASDARVISLEAVLLGAAGLLPEAAAAEADAAALDYLAELRRHWSAYGSPAAPRLRIGGPCRPANHPARRLAGLARLLAGGLPLLLARLRASVLAEARPALLQALSVPADGIWEERFLPWQNPAATPPSLALLGSSKALELAINAALPVLLAMAEREADAALAAAVVDAFHRLPAPPGYGRTAHLERALRDDGRRLIDHADRSQGGLYLFANYCTRGGCGRCPLS